jgi:branched-subunit amino acid transport protein
MSFSTLHIWMIILLIGIGTFLIRFSFIGLIGSRPMPEWLLRHLRYTPVAVLPGLVAPMVLWPAATDGAFDTPRILAASVTILAGLFTKNVLLAIVCGVLALYGALYLTG